MAFLIMGLAAMAIIPLVSVYMLLMGLGAMFTTAGEAEAEDAEG